MSITNIRQVNANEVPDMVSILLTCLLFKLGGQYTFTLAEIQDLHAQYPSIRFALEQTPVGQPCVDDGAEKLTLTLQSRENILHPRPGGFNVG